ncbi:peptidoglycan-binding protein [Verrucosispora sp. TAA-831]|uniref:peptidoglycan-binding domain-containing protein n=1 Tax=Verrucosispora sp. TAA-831 TaxID=3422227 RepID=UPI003D6F5A76
MAVAAPVIVQEMADWTALGGGNSGIVGDGAHGSGFHRAANEVGPGDYSRRRDPAGADGPYPNWSWACAGDFRHGGDQALRTMHRELLARLMAGDPALSMVCEFIGQPWPDRPVYYWARWAGVSALALYTGRGHDLWSHIAWYRSRADQRANLWVPATGGMDMLCKKGDRGVAVETLQRMLAAAGFSPGEIDGHYWDKTSAALLACRKSLGSKATSGDTYSPAAYEQVHRAHAIRNAGQPGPRGPEGPRGPAGPKGDPAQPAQVDHRLLAREAIGLAAEQLTKQG